MLRMRLRAIALASLSGGRLVGLLRRRVRGGRRRSGGGRRTLGGGPADARRPVSSSARPNNQQCTRQANLMRFLLAELCDNRGIQMLSPESSQFMPATPSAAPWHPRSLALSPRDHRRLVFWLVVPPQPARNSPRQSPNPLTPDLRSIRPRRPRSSSTP